MHLEAVVTMSRLRCLCGRCASLKVLPNPRCFSTDLYALAHLKHVFIEQHPQRSGLELGTPLGAPQPHVCVAVGTTCLLGLRGAF